MFTETRSYSKGFFARIAGCLALLLLSTSILSASHVHDLESTLGQGHFEHCAAYHIADHQQPSTTEIPAIAVSGSESCFDIETLSFRSHSHFLPPSRGPPSIS
jgi:hypothetical protein